MRRPIAILATGLFLLASAGCGEPSDSTPVACLEGAGAYVRALGDAPRPVKLRGETPIGECLAENQQAGDLATVGTALVAAATRLNAEARAEPGGNANLQLGYLLGAAEHAAENTDGIHTDLIRRLSAAARYSPDNRPLSPAFLRAYREGFDAGHAQG
ncbi:MAG TPA: hypothetical protein VGN84_07215 [Solirubrobacterales bacterium]|nr:hypothetical protein [Solirubrobacterales bacterium]